MESHGCAQVSMNIKDVELCPRHKAYEEVCQQAEKRGVKVSGSELIGLTPLRLLEAAGRHFGEKQRKTDENAGFEDLMAAMVRGMGLDALKPLDHKTRVLICCWGKGYRVGALRLFTRNLPCIYTNTSMSSEKQKEFMREAIRLSVENVTSGKGGPFGAVIVKNGEIIARGTNQVIASNDPTAHAEVIAIRNACKELGSFQLHGCELYTSCEPCPMCLGAIYWARPDKLYFANTKKDAAEINFDDQFIYEEMELPYQKRKLETAQMMRDEALEAFRLWTASNNRTEY